MPKAPLERGNNFKRERYQQLLDAGFPKDWVDELTLQHPALDDNPKAKIEGLRQRRFENPTKLITSLPAILGYAFDNIDAKIEGLKSRGFENPTKLITTLPPILGLAFENIDAKIEGLKQRGFENPTKLITSSPGYAFENIDAKIEGLKSRGFENPTKLITTLPPILGYAFENIDRKIRLLYLLHGDRTKAISELQAFPPLLGYKWRRLLFAVRTSHPDGLRKLITISPQLLAAAKGGTGSDNPALLAAEARALKGLDTDQIIEELVSNKRIDPRLIRALSRI
jgi:hypothetical protein